MRASDVMTSPVVAVKPYSSVQDIARLFVNYQISGAPVVDDAGKLLGVISEGDLLRRTELNTERPRSWWLGLLTNSDSLAADYIKSHSQKAADLMSHPAIAIAPDASLAEIAAVLEKHNIKRVPVVEDGRLVGIVSRANVIQALASLQPSFASQPSDETIRETLSRRLGSEPWVNRTYLNVIVNDGFVDLWGLVDSDAQRRAIQVAAETTHGVRAVNNHLRLPNESGTPTLQ